MGKWQNLTAKQKAEVIRFAIQNGVSDIKTIRDTYNLYSNGNQEEVLNKVNSSNANFVQRLKDPNRKNIPDWESPTDRISTHKLGVGTDENGNQLPQEESTEESTAVGDSEEVFENESEGLKSSSEIKNEKTVEKSDVKKSEVKVWECRNCGHILVGDKAPEVCPTCNHAKAYFEIHAENY